MNEILNEKTIASSSNYNISIRINPTDDRLVGFLPDPYFKVYNNTIVPRATAVARISILRPKYVKHTYGLKTFVLGKKEIGFVKKTLLEPIHGYETAWKYMIAFLVDMAKERNIHISYDENLPMPDYLQLL